MPRRNLVPFVLLALLVVLALVFAAIGLRSSPNRASLTVQNATSATFGDPPGSSSFSMIRIDSLAPTARSARIRQERLITYHASSHLTVSQRQGSTMVRIAVLAPAAVPCIVSTYTGIVGGSTAWNASGNTYTRVESLADFSARVPDSSAPDCAPVPSAVRGTVAERAILRSGYLVDLTLVVNVPSQRTASGRPAAHGVEGERLELQSIGGTPVTDL